MGVSGWGVQAWGADSDSDNPPLITIVSPTPGLIPGSFAQAATTPLIFDVTDVTPDLQDVLLWISFDGGANAEVVHDHTAFFARYSGGSTRVPIVNGYRYSLLREGGWPSDLDAIQLTVKAYDSAGNTV